MTPKPGSNRILLCCERLEQRDTPSGMTWEYQSFDSIAPGSMPANWQQWNSAGANSFAVTNSNSVSGDRALGTSALSTQSARAWLGEVMPADFGVSANVYLDALQPIQF